MGSMVKGPILNALVGFHLAQFGIIQQAVFVQFVFHIGEGELSAIYRNVQFVKASRATRQCGLRGRG